MKFSLFIIFYSFYAFAQVSISTDSISFPQILAGTSDSLFVYVKNDGLKSVNVKIQNIKSVFIVSNTILSISAKDSSIIWIKYKPNQNVIDKDLIFISSDDSSIGSVCSVSGSCKFGDNYDATTFNLYDNQLETALTQLVSGHTSLGYNLARDKMFMEIDNQKVNGQGAAQNTLECVYTGRLAIGYTSRAEAQVAPYNFNTEHTWPQSNFNEDEPMRSDLYHLYPTDITANSMRANYPFGNVVSNITWQGGGSKLGLNNLGQIVFEPRDVHKGDVSRSMFYFITCYPVNYGGFFTQTQEGVFREWNKIDPVGSVEAARNDAIAALQLKRNPFIDHPEFVDRIYSFATNNDRPTFAEIKVLPSKINFDSTIINNSMTKEFYIANSGNGQLSIDSIKSFNSNFPLSNIKLSINPYSFEKISVSFKPDYPKEYSDSIKVYSNGIVSKILVKGFGKDNTVNVMKPLSNPLSFSLEPNYPNPFNPSTKISWQLPVASQATLKVYDILGKEIEILVSEHKQAGKYETDFNAEALPSGVYFYQLKAGEFLQTRKMILLK